jgi:hypothetical protein
MLHWTLFLHFVSDLRCVEKVFYNFKHYLERTALALLYFYIQLPSVVKKLHYNVYQAY